MRVAAATSWRLLAILAALGVAGWIIAYLGVITIPVAIAVLAPALFAPLVDPLTRWRVPPGPATLVAITVGLLVLGGVLALVAAPISASLPQLWDQLTKDLRNIAQWLQRGPLHLSQAQLQQTLLGVPLAVPLAGLLFIGAFFPIIGAIVAGAIAALVTLVTTGPLAAVIVVAILIAVTQLESRILQPRLLGQGLRLHPLAVILSLAVGLVIAGTAGALLAIPILAATKSVIGSLLHDHPSARPRSTRCAWTTPAPCRISNSTAARSGSPGRCSG